MERILIYEDDESIKDELTILLRSNGYMPVSEPPCELALLDVNMPGQSGYEICRSLRKNSDMPIIFLTARCGAEDEILGFGVGADDFIKKPYNSSVLLARIARLLKRKTGNLLSAKGVTLNLTSMTAEKDGKQTELTKNEMKILSCLLKKELCSREEIMDELWSDSVYIDGNTLGVNINRLREKLAAIGAGKLIRTVRGVGYRL